LNDCKQNYSYPIGFAEEYWTREEAERLLPLVEERLQPVFKGQKNLETYRRRAERVGAVLYDVRQAHVGTDQSKFLIQRLMDELAGRGVRTLLEREVTDVREGDGGAEVIVGGTESLRAAAVIVAPGRRGFGFLQRIMEQHGIPYIDNIVDVGIRVETRLDNYPIVRDYYDPEILLSRAGADLLHQFGACQGGAGTLRGFQHRQRPCPVRREERQRPG
jgi:uncharacterized FAD-dependent dehydrogenase